MSNAPTWTSGNIDSDLFKAICSHKCVLFVGSGLSRDVRHKNTGKALPTWAGLLQDMLNWAIQVKIPRFTSDWAREIDGLVQRKKFLIAAQELRDGLAEAGQLQPFLRAEFDPQALDPGDNHLLLPDITFRAIVTTNYDTLIEKGYETRQGSTPPVLLNDAVHQLSMPYLDDDFFVFKMHGQYDGDVILGTRDYQTAMFNQPAYQRFVSWLFQTYTMLFVGFGGDDPNLGLIVDQLASLFKGMRYTHYLLMDKAEFNAVECRRWQEDRHIRVIRYNKATNDDHSQVNAFFRALAAFDCKGTGTAYFSS